MTRTEELRALNDAAAMPTEDTAMPTARTPASKLPWYVYSDTDILSAGDHPVATTHWDGAFGTSDEYADAAYIVEACNAYPRLLAERAQLVEALRAMSKIAGRRWRPLPADSHEKVTLNAATALIASLTD
jgi:hypothetical protein